MSRKGHQIWTQKRRSALGEHISPSPPKEGSEPHFIPHHGRPLRCRSSRPSAIFFLFVELYSQGYHHSTLQYEPMLPDFTVPFIRGC